MVLWPLLSFALGFAMALAMHPELGGGGGAASTIYFQFKRRRSRALNGTARGKGGRPLWFGRGLPPPPPRSPTGPGRGLQAV